MSMRQQAGSVSLLVAVLCAGCSTPSAAVPSAGESHAAATPADPSATPSPDVEESVVASPSAEAASPEPATAGGTSSPPPPSGPSFTLAARVRPTVEGVRVRERPGTDGVLLGTMPVDALGIVELGPLPVDGYDWYLIRYAFLNDSGVTDGAIGWVASGPADTPWLRPTDEEGWCCPFTAGASDTGSRVLGPVEIGVGYGVRWAAVGEDCPLVVRINDVAVVSTRVHGFAEGEESLFEDYPQLVGTFEFEVETECSWTLSHGTYQG